MPVGEHEPASELPPELEPDEEPELEPAPDEEPELEPAPDEEPELEPAPDEEPELEPEPDEEPEFEPLPPLELLPQARWPLAMAIAATARSDVTVRMAQLLRYRGAHHTASLASSVCETRHARQWPVRRCLR